MELSILYVFSHVCIRQLNQLKSREQILLRKQCQWSLEWKYWRKKSSRHFTRMQEKIQFKSIASSVVIITKLAIHKIERKEIRSDSSVMPAEIETIVEFAAKRSLHNFIRIRQWIRNDAMTSTSDVRKTIKSIFFFQNVLQSTYKSLRAEKKGELQIFCPFLVVILLLTIHMCFCVLSI